MKKLFVFSILLAMSSYGLFGQVSSVQLLSGAGVPISLHNSIGSAYGAIPGTLTQAYIIEVKTTYTGTNEVYPITFVNKTGASSTNTIVLRPESSAASISIQGNVSGDPVLYLNNADYVIVDGRPGGSGSSIAFTFTNLATTSSSNTIELANGASNNVIRNCTINNSTIGSAGRNVAMLTGSADNLLTQCIINAGRYAVNVNGSTSASNTIRSCKIINPVFVAIWVQSSAAGIVIDSNEIYSSGVVHDADYGVILFDAQADTAIISRNWIHDLNTGNNTTATIGIHIRTSSTSQTDYVSMENNFIDLTNTITVSRDVVGIKFSGSNAINAGIYFNTIRIGGTLSSGGTSGDVGSACLQNTATSVNNSFDSKNNILVSNRTGGTFGLRHVCSDLASLSGTIVGDFNIYSSSNSEIATLGTTLFTTLASYQTAASPNEVNANTQAITFASGNDLHLHSAMGSITNLNGVSIAGISSDIDGEPRVIPPARGADELQPCSGTPEAGTIVASGDSVCPDILFTLQTTGTTSATGLDYQWQSRPLGGSFTNISGSTSYLVNDSLVVSTQYRCIISCGGSSDFTDTVTLHPFPNLSITSISTSNVSNAFSFIPIGVVNATNYLWDFGDGGTSTSVSPNHSYLDPGSYTVSLIVSNQCDQDTVFLNVDVDCFGTPGAAFVSAQPTTVCWGEPVELIVIGANPVAFPFYSLQWQSSVNGGSFTDITGATNDTLIEYTPVIGNLDYRCIVSCGASGLSSISNTVSITVIWTAIDSINATALSPYEFQFNQFGASNITSQTWDFGDGSATSSLVSPTHQYTAPGVYNVVFNGLGDCDVASTTTEITVECVEGPGTVTGQLTPSGKTLTYVANGASDNVTYSWSFGDGNTSTDSSGTHTYATPGTYNVTLIVSNPCGSSTSSQDITIVVGIDELANHSIHIFPNPSENMTLMTFDHSISNGQLHIRSVSGQLLHSESGLSGSQIALSAQELHLPAGTYFVEIRSSELNSTATWLVK